MKKLIFLISILAVVVFAGCSTDPITAATGKPVPPSFIYESSLTTPHQGASAEVTFLRDTGFLGSGCTHDIYVNKKKVFSIDPGQYLTLYLTPGRYFFQLKTGGGWCPNVDVSQQTILDAGDHQIYRDTTPSNFSLSLTRIQ